jgi:hypothetical protein
MRMRDVATIAFRLLALWVVVSALTSLSELLVNWKTVAAQVMGTLSNMKEAPTRSQLFWMSTSAMLGRGLIGVIVWWLSPFLARVTCPGEDGVPLPDRRRDLYAAAAFLVGLWLIAGSAPGLAFAAIAATRPGTPAYPETQPVVPFLLAQFGLGISFLRSQWLIRWAMGGPGTALGEESGSAAQQRDSTSEGRDS